MGRVKEELFDKYQADQQEERYFKALEELKEWRALALELSTFINREHTNESTCTKVFDEAYHCRCDYDQRNEILDKFEKMLKDLK